MPWLLYMHGLRAGSVKIDYGDQAVGDSKVQVDQGTQSKSHLRELCATCVGTTARSYRLTTRGAIMISELCAV